MKVLRTAPLALGFATWRFQTGEDSLVLAVKGSYRLVHDGRAEPLEPDDVLGDVFCGEEPDLGACRYASDVVPFKPKADLLLVGRLHTPAGKPLPRCSATFGVGERSETLHVSGDRYWLDPLLGKASEPAPFSEMALGYERAFGGPGWAANPAGRGVFGREAREALARPLPNVEDPRALVRAASDRPPPAGFGPLAPHWSYRMARWPAVDARWVEERWPWAPAELDYTYFNAAQPALQVEGYLRGDETISCENLHPQHRRYRCELPRLRPRCFVVDQHEGAERFREVPLKLDTLWVDMDAEKLVLVWRGSVPVASEEFDEVSHVYLACESHDEARLPATRHRQAFELARLEADAPPAAPPGPAAAASNDNDAPAPVAPAPPPAPKPPPAPLLEPKLRGDLAKKGAPPEVLAALDRGDLEGATTALMARTGKTRAELDALVATTRERMKASLLASGADPKMFEPPPPPKPPAPKAPRAEPSPAWSRARVEAAIAVGDLPRGTDLSGLDLSRLDFRERDLGECILRGAKLDDARFEGAKLAGANLSGATAERASFRDAVLRDADLTGLAAAGSDFAGAELAGAVFDDAALAGCKLAGCKAANASFARADLSAADLARAELSGARFDGARLDGAVFRDADLADASAEGAQGSDVEFQRANLTGFRAASVDTRLGGAKLAGCKAERARFMGADLAGADLTRALLRGADLSRTNLAEARLGGADCRDADFTKARLGRATLAGANLHAARLEAADLRGADLRGASLYGAQLWRARIEGVKLEGAFTAGTLLETPVRGWAR